MIWYDMICAFQECLEKYYNGVVGKYMFCSINIQCASLMILSLNLCIRCLIKLHKDVAIWPRAKEYTNLFKQKACQVTIHMSWMPMMRTCQSGPVNITIQWRSRQTYASDMCRCASLMILLFLNLLTSLSYSFNIQLTFIYILPILIMCDLSRNSYWMGRVNTEVFDLTYFYGTPIDQEI